MKLIKRIMSVLLILTMSAVVNVFAKEDIGDDYETSMEFLTAANIIRNYTDDDLQKKISRIEFAKIIAGIVFPDDNYYWLSEKEYADVVSEYKAVTSALAEQKIMLGYDDDTFAPEEMITYNEALKALVSLVGYDHKAISAGGYPNGYMSCASDIGILKNFKNRTNHELTLGEISRLIENTLKIDIITITFNGNKASYSSSDGENLLKRKFDIYEAEGLMKATEFTNIYGGEYAGKNSVRIDEYSYEINDTAFESYLGHQIKFYYKAAKENSEDRILVSVKDNKNLETVSFTTNEITDFSDRTYRYCRDNEKNEQKAKLVDNAIVLYNYRPSNTKSDNELYMPDEGKIELIDNDGDGKFDVVFIWEYETYVVDDVSAESETVHDYYGKESLDLDPDKIDYTIIKNGEKINLNDIEQWNVLSVAKSDDNNPYMTIVVSDTRVTGAASSFSEDYITIDGTEYRLSSVFSQKRNVSQTFDYYLDSIGCIAVYDKNSGSEYIYHGIITGYRIVDETSDDPPELKVFNEEGVMTWYKAAKKITFDGLKGQKSTDVFNRENISVIIDDEGIIPQMIAYKINKRGEINYIDTIEPGENEDEECLNQSKFYPTKSGYQYMLLGHSWNDEIAMANGLTIFKAPADKEGNIYRGLKYEKYYAVQQWGVWNNPFYDHYDIYPVRFFNINESQVADLMVWYVPVDGSDAHFNTLMMVKGVENVLNEDEEVVLQLVGWSKGVEEKFIVESGREELVQNLKAGEVIQYALNKSGEIMAIKNLVNPLEDKYMISSTVASARTRCLFGVITSVDRDNNVIIVKYNRDEKGQLSGPGIVNVLNGESGNKGVVLKYNSKTNKMEKGTWSDLKVGQEVVLDKNETAVRSVTILEKK